MYKFWGWLIYFLMGIQFIVTAVNKHEHWRRMMMVVVYTVSCNV